jgi:hypothetical protein
MDAAAASLLADPAASKPTVVFLLLLLSLASALQQRLLASTGTGARRGITVPHNTSVPQDAEEALPLAGAAGSALPPRQGDHRQRRGHQGEAPGKGAGKGLRRRVPLVLRPFTWVLGMVKTPLGLLPLLVSSYHVQPRSFTTSKRLRSCHSRPLAAQLPYGKGISCTSESERTAPRWQPRAQPSLGVVLVHTQALTRRTIPASLSRPQGIQS